MKKYCYLLIILLWANSLPATTFAVYEANYPGVKDYNVNIDEATLVVHPRGNFVEMNLYLTVSYDFNSWFFKNYNELEFLWEFSLPEQAIMHDLWVWFGDSIMSAEVLDKWTAELLFSDVSSPVRNPGLLTQSKANRDGQVNYKLKLFPLMRNEKKRFKIQYLLPGRPTVASLRVWLPITQLVSPKTRGIDELMIIYKPDENPSEPQIIGTDVNYSAYSPMDLAWVLKIPLEFDQFVELVLPSPIQDQYYFSTFEQRGETFYHFAVYPPEVPPIQTPRNIVIAIDLNRYNTDGLDGEFLLSYLKETLQQALSVEDSINLIIAYDEIIQGSQDWIGCSESNIDDLFSDIMKRSFPSYSNFQPLMSRAANFINSHPDSSEVLLFTNTDEISLSTNDKTQFADEVIAMFKSGTKLHFIDLENKSRLQRQYNPVSGGYYYETQLQSFYAQMAYATEGNLFFLRYHSIKSIINAFLYERISHFETVEVQMRFQEGYSHSKHLLALHEGYYPIHFPIMQVGKFDGRLPMEVKVLGKTRSHKVTRQFTITESDVTPGTSQIVTSWYGDHIRSLLRYQYSPLTVNDIINLSIEQRILTPYSGFLIFYPDETHGFCQDCFDETQLLEVESVMEIDADTTIQFSAFPNPFNNSISITVQIPDNGNFDLSIFNVLGQKVYSPDLYDRSGAFRRVIQWDGLNDNGRIVTSGVYFAVLKASGFRRTLKLLLIR